MSTVGNIIAVIGFVIVIAIGIWGAVAAVRLAPRMFENIAATFRGESAIEVALPSSVKSGEPFDLSWSDKSRKNGLYTLSYACVPGFSLDAPTPTGDFELMPCNTSYAITASETSVRLIPKLSGVKRADVPFTISHLTTSSEKQAEGTAVISVVNPAPVVKQPEPTPKITTPAPTPKPIGKPDLLARVIAIGVIDPYSGQFISKNVFGSYETVTVKFDVVNTGTGPSGTWTFSTSLPTRVPTGYVPPMQSSIGAGAKTELTLNFSQPISGTLLISIDPSNVISETNEYNNSLSQYISVAY